MFWPFKRKKKEEVKQVTIPRMNYGNPAVPQTQVSESNAAYMKSRKDEGFDSTGFAVGAATGIPVALTTGAIMGAAIHHSSKRDDAPISTPSYTPVDSTRYSESKSYESTYSSPSYESSSSYSSSSDSSSSGSSSSSE